MDIQYGAWKASLATYVVDTGCESSDFLSPGDRRGTVSSALQVCHETKAFAYFHNINYSDCMS